MMFTEIDKYFKNKEPETQISITGSKLKDYLDELEKSKVFRNSKIEIVPSYTRSTKLVEGRGKFELELENPLGTVNINKWSRFIGNVHVYSISLLQSRLNPSSDVYVISGYFTHCKLSHDIETAIKLDRLYELNQLDI